MNRKPQTGLRSAYKTDVLKALTRIRSKNSHSGVKDNMNINSGARGVYR